MKHFRQILSIARIVVALLFIANVICMARLYGSIKERYVDDVGQCLRRAAQIEIVDRIVAAGFGDDNGVVRIEIGLQKSDVGDASTVEDLLKKNYSQGYRSIDRQIVSVITQFLHDEYEGMIAMPDTDKMEEAFRRDLNFSGYYPETVLVAGPGETLEYTPDLWHLEYRVNDGIVYEAFISPLTGDILREMGGVIATSALIAIVLTLGFWYLLHVIKRLRTIEEMKDDFTNNMTHELKTPIAIAYAANDALLNFPDSGDEERTRKYLTASLDQLSKLAGLVENILAMSMERRRQLIMSKECISLRPFLSAIAAQQKLRADKPCEITVECPEDVSVEADPTHFSNVMNNLIDNSMKYSGNEVSVLIKADGRSVSVCDNGIGIPEKSLSEIFNKFYRVPQGNRCETRGYGIGLFYVRSIIDKHGWDIRVESSPGKGSTFTIIFRQQ